MPDTTIDTDRLAKRFAELSRRADERGCFLFSDFLGLAEQAVFHDTERTLPAKNHTLFGGAVGCERVMIRFGDADALGYELPFPIASLKIEPKSQKFADALSHRDFLGALMNLGVDRAKLGDIMIRDNVGYLFADEEIAPFIEEGLTRVKHTDVKISRAADLPEGELFRTKPVTVQVVGERIDAVVAKVFNISREESLSLFKKRLVFLDGRVVENNSAVPKQDGIISVRGYGRMIYRGVASLSKKGKLNLQIDLYV